jgi:hypothetical protein
MSSRRTAGSCRNDRRRLPLVRRKRQAFIGGGRADRAHTVPIRDRWAALSQTRRASDDRAGVRATGRRGPASTLSATRIASPTSLVPASSIAAPSRCDPHEEQLPCACQRSTVCRQLHGVGESSEATSVPAFSGPRRWKAKCFPSRKNQIQMSGSFRETSRLVTANGTALGTALAINDVDPDANDHAVWTR